MIASILVQSILQGVLGTRRKGSRRALRYLTGSRGGLWSNPAMLLGAAGVAWGVVETLQRQGGTPANGSADHREPPPTPSPVADDEAIRMIRLAISAAHADGALNEQERAAILQHATASGMADLVAAELGAPRPLSHIVGGVIRPEDRATLYVLAFTILRADEQVTGTERIYLAQLAHLLNLDPPTVAALEQDTGERIDALGDQGQFGG